MPSVAWAIQGFLFCAAGLMAAYSSFGFWRVDDFILHEAGAEHLGLLSAGFSAVALGLAVASLLRRFRESGNSP